MELRIRCDAKVTLKGLVNLVNVMCDINEYKTDGSTLLGSVNVKGNYIKDDLNTTYDFKETVPFTVVFKDDIKQIQKIEVEDFLANEIINNGIECKFNIHIEYQNEKNDDDVVTAESVNIIKDEEISEIDTTNNEDEKIKEDINKKYDQLLEEILESRDDNFLEEEEPQDENEALDAESIIEDENIEKKAESNFKITSSNSEVKPNFSNIRSSYSSYHVYYPKEESELEKICSKEKISIDRVYKDKANKDFKDKKRIIIK